MAGINPVASNVPAATARAPQPAIVAPTVLAPQQASSYAAYHPAAGSSYFANMHSISRWPVPTSPAMISSSLPLQQQRTWQPQPQPTTFFQANAELQGYPYQDYLPTVTGRRFFPRYAAPPAFEQPATQMQYYHQPGAVAMEGNQTMAAPVHAAAAPLVATFAADHAVPDPPPQEPAKRRRRNTASTASNTDATPEQLATTARRGRGRPRGSTASGKTKRARSAAPSRQEHPPPQQQPATATTAIIPQHDDINKEASGSIDQINKMKGAAVADDEPATSDQVAAGGDGAGQQVVQYANTYVPGVRFRPTDQELIIHYLRPKYVLRDDMPTVIVKQFDVCMLDLDELNGDLGLGESLDGAWYVFSPRNRYYEHGSRPARGIKTKREGYWKSNSAEADIVDDGKVIGRVNTLTLALGHQPKGEATHWRMKEYRIPEFQIPAGQDSTRLLDEWVLGKLYHSFAYKQKGKVKVNKDASKSEESIQDLSVDGCNISDIEANKPEESVQDLSVDGYNICDIEASKQDGGVQDVSVDGYNIFDIETSKPKENIQELSVDGYNICDIEANKPDEGVQDLSVDDYAIWDIDIAPAYTDPSTEETHGQNM